MKTDKLSSKLDQLMSAAAGEKLSALLTVEPLLEHARDAKRDDFVAFLNGSPDVPPRRKGQTIVSIPLKNPLFLKTGGDA